MEERRSFSSNELIVAAAIFVAAFSNVPFFRSALNAFGASAFVGSLFAYTVAVFVLLLSVLCHRALVKPVLTVFFMLSSVLAYFTAKYGTIFDYHMISNVFETNTAEAGDLFNPQLIGYIGLLGVLPSLALWWAPMSRPHWRNETIGRLKLVAAAGLVLGFNYLAFGGSYVAMVRERPDVANKVNPTYALYSVVKLAKKSIPTGQRTYEVIGRDAAIPSTDVHRELVIMVVGETGRADHWSLNGHRQPTSEPLAGKGVINFPDFWSCDTYTSASVPCMFSNLGRANFTAEKAHATDNALDVLSRAGVNVLWRDNNSDSKGVADRVTYQDFRGPDRNPICEGGECRDMGMLSGLQEHIDQQTGDILIVLHQMGNHGPAYYKRYPKEFERFTPVCRTNDLGSCTSEEINNAYDNAILYTNYFLSQVIDLLKKNDDKFETAMFYVADHGESLGEYGVFLHAMPYVLAPDAQKHVPAVLWLGENMKHDVVLETIEERRLRHWSHDNVFSTLLGMFEVRSDTYDQSKDLLVHKDENVAHSDGVQPVLR